MINRDDERASLCIGHRQRRCFFANLQIGFFLHLQGDDLQKDCRLPENFFELSHKGCRLICRPKSQAEDGHKAVFSIFYPYLQIPSWLTLLPQYVLRRVQQKSKMIYILNTKQNHPAIRLNHGNNHPLIFLDKMSKTFCHLFLMVHQQLIRKFAH